MANKKRLYSVFWVNLKEEGRKKRSTKVIANGRVEAERHWTKFAGSSLRVNFFKILDIQQEELPRVPLVLSGDYMKPQDYEGVVCRAGYPSLLYGMKGEAIFAKL
ncbi:MAG: hypothetical protein KDH96_02000 [Candidatus Riesia sp.]|nr:hypothetical protein [Candidatus Riesia sp.]